MEMMKAFLNKIEEDEEKEEEEGYQDHIRKKVKQVRSIMFDMEDVLDDIELLQQRGLLEDGRRRRRMIINDWCSHFIDTIVSQLVPGNSNSIITTQSVSKRSISKALERIRKAIEEMKGNDDNSYYEYIFKHQGGIHLQQQQQQEKVELEAQHIDYYYYGVKPLYKQESELVGLDERKQEIIKLLDLENLDKPVLIAVWGEQGVGKTTIVHKVFDDDKVKENFTVRAWINATKPYNRVALLKSLLSQFLKAQPLQDNIIIHRLRDLLLNEHHQGLDTEEIKCLLKPFLWGETDDVGKLDNEVLITNRLQSHLEENKIRYMVVLDDVSETEELINYVKAALVPTQSNGCRILMTTNREGIAHYWKASFLQDQLTYNLPCLSETEADDLFCKKAFGKGSNEQLDLIYFETYKEIVDECDGLPFLIEKVAAECSSSRRWVGLNHKFQSNPVSGRDKRAFLSRYYTLPDHLKPCFLYLCMFPKGDFVNRMRLLRLWIAEGFIRSHDNGGSTPEETAEEYLNELIERCMVRVVQKDDRGRAKRIRLPPFWHRLLLPKLEAQGFCLVVLGQHVSSLHSQCRRMSVQEDIKDTVIPSSVRSILSFVEAEVFPIRWTCPLQPTMCFRLKVLDLQEADFELIPEAVGLLHSLRYLNLRGTNVKKLPLSIGGLWNLQTLDLKETELIEELPSSIKNLVKLRHLLAYSHNSDDDIVGMKIPPEAFQSFEDLQKLECVDASYRDNVVTELRCLKQLKKLMVTQLKTDHGPSLCKSLLKMNGLRSLGLRVAKDQALDLTFFDELGAIHLFSSLEHLYLVGPLVGGKLPKCMTYLYHLTILYLENSGFESDPLTWLCFLKRLVVLHLAGYQGTELNFDNANFRNLEELRLSDAPNLERIEASDVALPQLQKALCSGCPKLKATEIPPQISQVVCYDYE